MLQCVSNCIWFKIQIAILIIETSYYYCFMGEFIKYEICILSSLLHECYTPDPQYICTSVPSSSQLCIPSAPILDDTWIRLEGQDANARTQAVEIQHPKSWKLPTPEHPSKISIGLKYLDRMAWWPVPQVERIPLWPQASTESAWRCGISFSGLGCEYTSGGEMDSSPGTCIEQGWYD